MFHARPGRTLSLDGGGSCGARFSWLPAVVFSWASLGHRCGECGGRPGGCLHVCVQPEWSEAGLSAWRHLGHVRRGDVATTRQSMARARRGQRNHRVCETWPRRYVADPRLEAGCHRTGCGDEPEEDALEDCERPREPRRDCSGTGPGHGSDSCSSGREQTAWTNTARGRLNAEGSIETERRRSRTDRAVGCTTALVLKTSWATGPMPLRCAG